ncbi:MAG TPA: RNA methyltransferase, partial [Ktedonobacterales bacterium]|nr:RNA methyltransferase [Ktedonobacterales bacterium]
PSNQHIALLRSLHTPKGREQEAACLLEGPHLLAAAFEANVTPRLIVYESEVMERSVEGRRLRGQIEAAGAAGAQVYEASRAAIERAADTQTPQGVVAAVALTEFEAELLRARRRGRMRPVLLVLDAISDPGNMGTLLRSALAADVDEVLLAPECADPFAPKVLRAGAGAHLHLPIRRLDWPGVQVAIYGAPQARQVVIAEAKAHTEYDALDFTQRTALIIGSEAHGPSAEAGALATASVRVPMWNRVESLNAAIAGSVILFEAARQRRVAETRATARTTED